MSLPEEIADAASRRLPFPVDAQKIAELMRRLEGTDLAPALAKLTIEMFAQWAENQARIAYVCVDCIGKGSTLATGEARCCDTCDGSGRVYR